MKKLTKKQKSAIFAWAVNFGFWDYNDTCEWKEHLHKYRYYSADESKVYYCSQRMFAENFDCVLDADERREMKRDYNAYQKHIREYELDEDYERSWGVRERD